MNHGFVLLIIFGEIRKNKTGMIKSVNISKPSNMPSCGLVTGIIGRIRRLRSQVFVLIISF